MNERRPVGAASRWLRIGGVVVACAATSCSNDGGGVSGEPVPATSSTASAAPASGAPTKPRASAEEAAEPAAENEPLGDAAAGKKLVGQFECARCHDGLAEIAAVPAERHCTHCHQKVLKGDFDHKPDHTKWRKNVKHLSDVPSLSAAGQRLHYPWVVGYLMKPHDLRPNLTYDMPRLALERTQARDIATYLASLAKRDDTPDEASDLDLTGADLDAGKALLAKKGCGSCHTMSRTDTFEGVPKPDDKTVAVMLAPDLLHARKRLRPDAIMAWLKNPLKMKPGTLMPQTPMSEAEAKNIVAFLLRGPIRPQSPPPIPALPKALERKVAFSEVNDRIFAKICRHCHGNPDEAIGDGGPGNTGGFGFKPRGLELTSYQRLMAGYTDDAGERHSVFTKTQRGVPRLVASLMARHGEVGGVIDEEVRGMPLGLPPLPIEDIQLLVTWIEQGRRR